VRTKTHYPFPLIKSLRDAKGFIELRNRIVPLVETDSTARNGFLLLCRGPVLEDKVRIAN